jgi:filamentous hemagglutinin family protein
MKNFKVLFTSCATALSIVALSNAATAQVIATPTTELGATNTIVTQSNGVFDITGGQTAGANLFHSFSQFGLSQGQTANFQTNAAIQNVLARINGGSPSAIDGILQLTGSTANLYLMNPAGIIFGPNATLNLPGSFTATTATGVGFGSKVDANAQYDVFQAVGNNNYANMSGVPYSFNFPKGAAGAIVHDGNLIPHAAAIPVTPTLKGDLTLIGNTIFGGILHHPTGNLVLATASEASQVILGQAGSENLGNPLYANYAVNTASEFSSFPIPKLSSLISQNRFSYSLYGLTVSSDGQISYRDIGFGRPPMKVLQPGSLSYIQLTSMDSDLPADKGQIRLLVANDLDYVMTAIATNRIEILTKNPKTNIDHNRFNSKVVNWTKLTADSGAMGNGATGNGAITVQLPAPEQYWINPITGEKIMVMNNSNPETSGIRPTLELQKTSEPELQKTSEPELQKTSEPSPKVVQGNFFQYSVVPATVNVNLGGLLSTVQLPTYEEGVLRQKVERTVSE